MLCRSGSKLLLQLHPTAKLLHRQVDFVKEKFRMRSSCGKYFSKYHYIIYMYRSLNNKRRLKILSLLIIIHKHKHTRCLFSLSCALLLTSLVLGNLLSKYI